MLENTWVGYIARSYQQIKADILAKLPITNPEITDHTEGNILVRMVSVWAGLCEQLNYYIDSVAREIFLPTALEYATGVYHALTADYRIRSRIAATVDITLYFNGPVASGFTLFAGSQFQTTSGVIFRCVVDTVIPTGATEVILPCENTLTISGESLGTSLGTANQIFVLAEDVVDGQVELTVGGTTYTFVSSFVFAKKTDTVFSTNIDGDGNCYVVFGDGVNGFIPPSGADIVATYKITSGASGNVASGTITQIVSLTLPSGVTATCVNINGASGGYDVESLSDLKKNIPLSLRTLDRAVTGQDYVDIAVLCNGVAQAAVSFNCGKLVYVYVIANGGSLASSALLKRVENWFEDKRMVTTKVQAMAAGIIDVIVYATVVAKKSYLNSTVETNIKNDLSTRYSVANQTIKGSVYIGDIYQTMENADGVERTEITLLTFKPAALPRLHTTALVWSAEMLAGSISTVSWVIKATGSTTVFALYRGALFVGNFAYGTEHTFPELKLNVTYSSSYASGNTWDFKTYKVGGSITVDELSIPLIQSSNVILSVSGGI